MTFRVSLILLLWIRSFGFTIVAEAPVYILLGYGRVGIARAFLAGALGSCITHPLLWFVWPRVVADYHLYVTSGELLVAIIEAIVFYLLARPVGIARAVAASFLANAWSFGLGLFLRHLGMPL